MFTKPRPETPTFPRRYWQSGNCCLNVERCLAVLEINFDLFQKDKIVPSGFDVEFFFCLTVPVKQSGVNAFQNSGIGVTDPQQVFALVRRLGGRHDP